MAGPVVDFDPVRAFHAYLGHFCLHSGRAISGNRPAIGAGAEQEMSTGVARGTKQLVDIALAIRDVDAPRWLTQQRARVLKIEQPAQALLLRDRHPRGIDLPLQRVGSLELLARPKFRCRQSQRQTRRRDHQTGMQRDSAERILMAPVVARTVLGLVHTPMFSLRYESYVVSCKTSIVPLTPPKRSRVLRKCPARMSSSVTRSLSKKR